MTGELSARRLTKNLYHSVTAVEISVGAIVNDCARTDGAFYSRMMTSWGGRVRALSSVGMILLVVTSRRILVPVGRGREERLTIRSSEEPLSNTTTQLPSRLRV